MRAYIKRIIAKKANKQWKRKLKWKAGKKQKKRYKSSLDSLHSQLNHTYNIQHANFVKIRPPKNFSFVANSNEVIGFINKVFECFLKRQKLFIRFREVEHIEYDALVVLLSILVRFSSHNIQFNGDFPVKRLPAAVLKSSGFFEYLYEKFMIRDSYVLNAKSRIHTHASKHVDPSLGKTIIRDSSETIWGENRRSQGVQRAFLELMQNTHNHAEIGKEGDKHWWLSASHSKSKKKVLFSFVDFGVGVFKSLDSKKEGSKWGAWKKLMPQKHKYSNNAELLKLILNGELHKTVTDKPYRGKGLPGLKLLLERNQISNLYIITNDVKADVKNDIYNILDSNFSGTFVFWELNEQNLSCNDTFKDSESIFNDSWSEK